MNVGFIGTGNMGSILIEAFIQSGALEPSMIIANNRTRYKVERLLDKYPGLRAARSNIEVALGSDIIFLCIKPGEYRKVTEDLKKIVLPSQIAVIITSPVLIKHLEAELNCKVAKVIPSVTNYALSGATLCIYGEKITNDDREQLERLLEHFSTPLRISEEYTRVTSDLSSCGPAFLAFFLQKFIDAAVEETGISKELATRLASEMALGTAKLLTSGGFTPESLQEKVCVPGGITAEGLRMMANELDGMFNQLIRTTHAKFYEDLEKTHSQFSV